MIDLWTEIALRDKQGDLRRPFDPTDLDAMYGQFVFKGPVVGWVCPDCGKTFRHRDDLGAHLYGACPTRGGGIE
jgi:hypothetical protein